MSEHIITPLRMHHIHSCAGLVAKAFHGRPGLPEQYRPAVISERLRTAHIDALNGRREREHFYVAEIDGVAVGLGGFVCERFASATWSLVLGATHPDHQGKGIGHALVEERLTAIAACGGRLVLVSTKAESRWLRYGFTAGPVNPASGATILWRALQSEPVEIAGAA